MKYKGRMKIAFGAIIILVIAQLLNFVLCISSFEKVYRGSLISKYQIIARELKKEIEIAVNFGKPIEKYNGMQSLIREIAAKDKNINNIFVTMPDGLITGSTEAKALQRKLSIGTLPSFPKSSATRTISAEDFYYVSMPIFHNDDQLVGMIFVQFHKGVIMAKVKEIIYYNISYFAAILFGAVLLLILLLFLVDKIAERSGAQVKRRVSLQNQKFVLIVLVLIAAQFYYTYINTNYFRKVYLEVTTDNITVLSGIIQEDIESLLKLGLPADHLKGMEKFFARSLHNFAECREIDLTFADGTILYKSDGKQNYSILDNNAASEPKRHFYTQRYIKVLQVKSGQYHNGQLNLAFIYNQQQIEQRIREILLDAITIILVSLIFSFEMLFFLSMVAGNGGRQKNADGIKQGGIRLIRIAAFTFFFAELIPMSFLPLYIKSIYSEAPLHLWGLNADTILSIPVSAYMLGVTISIPIAGFLTKKHPVRRLFFMYIGLSFIGSLLSAFATNIYGLTIFRFISGFAYGGVIINGVNFVVANTSNENRSTGFGHWSAGYAAASICALPISSVIVSKMGYRAGMLLSFFAAIFFALVVFKYVRDEKTASNPSDAQGGFNIREIFVIFRCRNILANLFLISMPLQIAFVGVFQYFLPLYMNKIGISQGNIGRILTIYGLISIATPLISSLADKIRNNRIFMILGNLIIGLSFSAYLFTSNIYVVIISIACIGIGSTFVDAVEETFITETREAKEVGEAKLISIYTTYQKIAAVFAPMIVGLFMVSLSMENSIAAMGGIMLVGILIFALVSKGKGIRPGKTAQISAE